LKNDLNNDLNKAASELVAPFEATVCMAGDGRGLGYLHSTAPTTKRNGSGVFRLREDNACGVTIAFSTPLGPQQNVKILFSTGIGRVIDSFQSTHGELPTGSALQNEQNEQNGKDRLPSERRSKQECFRVWKNPNGTLEVSAIRAPKHWDTGVSCKEPQMYRFDLLVDNTDVHLWYRFDRLCKPLDGVQWEPDSGRGMFFAGSGRLQHWLAANGAPAGLGGGSRSAGGGGDADPLAECCATATAIAVPVTPVSLAASPRPLPPDVLHHTVTAALFDDALQTLADGSPDKLPADDIGEENALFGEPVEQLKMLPLMDWTPEETMLLSSLL
jgi:hypothetical protein